jgi:hypothetical protein
MFELTIYGDNAAVIRQQLGELLAVFGPPAVQETTNVHRPVAGGSIQSGIPPRARRDDASGERPVGRELPDVSPKRERTSGGKKAARAEDTPAEQIDLEEAIKDAGPAEAVTKNDLRAKLIELMNLKGEGVPYAMLQEEFGVSKIGELDAAKYADALAKAQALIDAED